MLDRDRHPTVRLTGAWLSPGSSPRLQQLSQAHFTRMTAYGTSQSIVEGDIVFDPGDFDYDVIMIESGWIEVLSTAADEESESVVARYGPGGFLGELNTLTGQTAHLRARVVEAGTIHRITRVQFRRLLNTEPELSEVVVRTLLARRDVFRD